MIFDSQFLIKFLNNDYNKSNIKPTDYNENFSINDYNGLNKIDLYENIRLNKSVEHFYEFSKWINVIIITLIIFLGFYGNFMTIVIFTSKCFAKNSLRILRMYLIIIAISDICVILFHYLDFTFRTWINLTRSHSSKFNFVDKNLFFCKLIPYLRNVFRAISIYALILVSTQRLVALYFPMVKSRWSSIYFNRKLIFLLFIFSISINLNNVFLNDLLKNHGENFCSINKNYLRIQFIFDIKFVIVTILIPIFDYNP